MTGPLDEQQEPLPERIVVPGSPARASAPDVLDDDDLDAISISEAQQVRDLGSASRSCVAVLAALLIIALLICVFLSWAYFIR